MLYWLARLGWTDTVLVERSKLTSGSTFHSAGLVGQLRGSLSLTRMMMNSVDLYRELGEEVGLETGWHEVGSLRLASSSERMEELSRQAGWAKTFGLPLELISAEEAQRLFPPMSVDGVLGAAYLPTDGYLDPSQLTFALAAVRAIGAPRSARRPGSAPSSWRPAGCAGSSPTRARSRPSWWSTRAACSRPRSAASPGSWCRSSAMAHQYLITKPSGLPRDMPTMRDPSLLVYYRPESGGLVMGGYERNPQPWGLDGIEPDFNGRLLAEDWDRFAPLMENAIVRTPSIREADVVKLINGPEAFTPDGEFILGPSEVPGLWVAAGFNAHGIAGAGGMGRLVAEWIVEGRPDLDAWEMDSRRFGRHYASREYTLARTREVYSTYYDVKYPGHERSAGRPLRVSPIYGRLAELGAAFGEKSGWERANWFEPNAARGDESLRPRGWAGRLWSPAIQEEHRACREAAGALRLHLLRQDRGPRPGLGRIPGKARRQPRRPRHRRDHLHPDAQRGRRHRVRLHGHPAGRRPLPGRHRHRLRPTRPVLDPRPRAGRWVGPGRGRHLGLRLRRPLGAARPPGAPAAHPDRPRQPGLPLYERARAGRRLRPLPRAARHLRRRAGLGALLPIRVRPPALGHDLGGGAATASSAGGYKAVDSLRLEKGYRVWGSDIGPESDPYQSGLGFCVKLDKGEFIGRSALLALREKPASTRLACLVLDDPRSVALGSEPVRIAGEIAGRVTSGGFGYTVGRSIAYAYVPAACAPGTPVEVEIFGTWVGEGTEEP